MNGIEVLERQMELHHHIFLICFVFFLIFVLLDLFLFWRLKIGRVFGYLTGKTAEKTIKEMMRSTGIDITDVEEVDSFIAPIFYERKEERAGQKNTVYGQFKIVKKIILIHTEEQL